MCRTHRRSQVWMCAVVQDRKDAEQTCVSSQLKAELAHRIYRVIRKSLRDFRTRLRNNQDRHGRKEHISR